MVEKRSLYQCFHARVKGGRIYCEKGHRFESRWKGKRTLSIDPLVSGMPLVFSICQGCIDYEPMGDPIPPEERGWIRYERFTTFDGTNEVANSLRLSLCRSV